MNLRLISSFILIVLMGTACPSRIPDQQVSPANQAQARRLLHEGDDLLRQGKDHLALLKYLESSTLDPFSPYCFNKLSIAYARILMFPQARRAVGRAIRLDPEYSFAYNTRGIVQLAMGRPAAAVSSFKKAIQFKSNHPIFFVNLGKAHLESGRFQKSQEAFQTAVQMDPDVFSMEGTISVEATREKDDSETYYRTARMFAQIGDMDTCVEYLSKALASGFRDGERLRKEGAFDAMRKAPAFTGLLSAYGMAG